MKRFKRVSAQIFGPILLVGGCVILYRTGYALWSYGLHACPPFDLFFRIGLISFLVWGGIRAVRMGYGDAIITGSRMTVWKLAIGYLLISVQMKINFNPSPDRLRPNNVGEAAGMLIATIFFYVIAAWLIFSGIRAKYKNIPSLDQPS